MCVQHVDVLCVIVNCAVLLHLFVFQQFLCLVCSCSNNFLPVSFQTISEMCVIRLDPPELGIRCSLKCLPLPEDRQVMCHRFDFTLLRFGNGRSCGELGSLLWLLNCCLPAWLADKVTRLPVGRYCGHGKCLQHLYVWRMVRRCPKAAVSWSLKVNASFFVTTGFWAIPPMFCSYIINVLWGLTEHSKHSLKCVYMHSTVEEVVDSKTISVSRCECYHSLPNLFATTTVNLSRLSFFFFT